MTDYYIETQNMAVGYHGRVLIRDICMGVCPGEIVTLIGPNGSGKSTILKSISRQLRLLGGKVLVEDADIHEISSHQLSTKMAVVMTEKVYPEMMSCYEVAAMGRYPYTGRFGILSEQDHQKVREALEMVEASELQDCSFDAVSDGQRQRILLARAICQDPEIIVLDEPTSFLDIHHKLKLLSILKKMTIKKKIAVLLSLHEIDLAQKISDRVICVKGNRIVRYGKPEEIFKTETIRELYDMRSGYYDPCFGSVEMPAPSGKPKVFVISSGGSGIPVYRKLQRENIPFAAGILYKNDIDYQLAQYLASEVIAEEPFGPIRDETLCCAMMTMKKCERVIQTELTIGEYNQCIRILTQAAQEMGILEQWV